MRAVVEFSRQAKAVVHVLGADVRRPLQARLEQLAGLAPDIGGTGTLRDVAVAWTLEHSPPRLRVTGVHVVLGEAGAR
jgi:hypothetical protein